jgi:3-(3-hydroxy-phenyl)propionate hydroxylase
VETEAINGAAPSSRHGSVRPPIGALVRGSVIAQGWVRGPDGTTCLSDDPFWQGLALIGFGIDATASLEHATAAAFARAGGSIVQIAHRGQRLHLALRDSWEDLEGIFLPGRVPVGRVAVARPDRTIVHDGPASDANRIVRESLTLLCDPVSAPMLEAEYAI